MLILASQRLEKIPLHENSVHVFSVMKNLAVPIEQAARDTNF